MRMYMRLLFGLVGRALRSRNDLLMENLVVGWQNPIRTKICSCARVMLGVRGVVDAIVRVSLAWSGRPNAALTQDPAPRAECKMQSLSE